MFYNTLNKESHETSSSTIVPLNIALTYPVKWKTFSIARDFLQNFYDAVGYDKWHSGFSLSYKEGVVKLEAAGINFNYEWLVHIGASTKRDGQETHAGYFGEGFKIAALCAYRDKKWTVRMRSGDWSLKVIDIDHQIDGKHMEMLAYDVVEDKSDTTCLELEGVSASDYELFQEVVNSFYYPENPLLGELIWEGKKGAVYYSAKESYSDSLPFTFGFGPRGPVFCSYQLRGSIPFDLVVCLHSYEERDHERETIYHSEIIRVIGHVVDNISASGAMKMLVQMKKVWRQYPAKNYDSKSWYPIVNGLVRRISEDKSVRDLFVKEFPNLLCISPIFTQYGRNRRLQAESWLKKQSTKYILGQNTFALMGYKSLEEACEENGGMLMDAELLPHEQRAFDLLEEVVQDIYGDFFDSTAKYDQRIIGNDSPGVTGMASLVKNYSKKFNNQGISFKFRTKAIYLKRRCFDSLKFHEALGTFVHEKCHVFGGDASVSFSLALTLAMEYLIVKRSELDSYETRWKEIFEILE